MEIKLAIVILTFNEELNLEKCLKSVSSLACPIYIIDSFSTDKTEEIAKKYHAIFIQNKFITHTLQWKFAINNINPSIDWILGLDADQTLDYQLQQEIKILFTNPSHSPHSGYYIKRKNYFLGRIIRYGGYQNRFLLKLFKRESVYLDESELMDHHFYVSGSTSKLKGVIVENNLKENLDFWKSKHIKYAELQAKEEFEKLLINKGSFFGNQDERRLFLKKIWNKMPLYLRPILYFIYRYFLMFGFLDGKIGAKFHYLQAYWYRRKIDENIYNLRVKNKKYYAEYFFVSRFLLIFFILYYFNLFFIGLTGKGGAFYVSIFDEYLNYIRWLRESIIYFSSLLLNIFNYETVRLPYHLKIINGVKVGVGYSCLGYGLMSMHIAIAYSYPFNRQIRRNYLFWGLLAIYIINIVRIAAVGWVYTEYRGINIDHHLIFNIISYLLIFIMMIYTIKLNNRDEDIRA